MNALHVTTASSNSEGTTDTIDTTLQGGDDDYNGWWLVSHQDNNEGEIVRVTDFVDSTGTLTHDALSNAHTSGSEFELWQEEYNPEDINQFMDDAIIEVTGRFFDPEEDITLFADGKTNRWDIPSEFDMLKLIEYRSKVLQKRIHDASSAWTAGTNVTIAADTKIRKQGNASNKLTIGAVSAGDVIAYKDITAIDISNMTHIEWWARASFTTTAADYKLLLDDTAGAVSAIELLDFPALTADVWQFCRVALAKADEDTAILSVGVEDNAGDNDNQTLWIDDVRAVNDDESEWTPYSKRMWDIDKEARDLILKDPRDLGYKLLKLHGGGNPTLLTSDTTVTEVDDQLIITAAIIDALYSHPENPLSNGGNLASLEGRKKTARKSLPPLIDVRLVA